MAIIWENGTEQSNRRAGCIARAEYRDRVSVVRWYRFRWRLVFRRGEEAVDRPRLRD